MGELPILPSPPFPVRKELDGWTLFWADLELLDGDDAAMAVLRTEVSARARARPDPKSLAQTPTGAEVRRLFRAAGCDPTRYRPASEALLRRIVKGSDLPAIHPLVDLNNCLSVELAVPCCVMAAGSFTPPLSFRAGEAGESYQSLRGPLRLEGKPLLSDAEGPLDCPITGNERVKVVADTREAWFVAYLPLATVDPPIVGDTLERLAAASGRIRVRLLAVS